MEQFDIRDPELARMYLLESILLSRAHPPSAENVLRSLRWCFEIANQGSPLPPVGIVADIGTSALRILTDQEKEFRPVPGLDSSLIRKYEDYVLGKFYADMNFERASDALVRYQNRDLDRAIAYIVGQLCQKCEIGGALLSPAVIKSLLKLDPADLMEQAWAFVEQEGISEQLTQDYESVTSKVQRSGELLGIEDIFELEHGTALAEFGQRIALRQVLRAANLFESKLPNQKPKSSHPRRYSVATNILEEDFYPVGGFSSISNKGTVESLLRSELAYIDKDVRPDLFDIKFARGELLYYSRDENQFLRRRLSFVFVLYPDLVDARFKDSKLPYQRIVLILASIVSMYRKIVQWLSDDALHFEILFVKQDQKETLGDERELLETIFREEIEGGSVSLTACTADEVVPHCDELGRTSLCHALLTSKNLSTSEEAGNTHAILSQVAIDGPIPMLELAELDPVFSEEVDIDGWHETLGTLLKFWM